MNKKSILINFLLILFASFQIGESQEEPWQKRRAEGWAWYHDLKEPKDNLENEGKQEKEKDPIKIMQTHREELERSLAKAMLEPTKKNILDFMILQKKWTNQSAYFSELWLKNVLENPEVASLVPTTQYGVQVKKKIEAKERKAFIQALANQSILIFFYEGKNPFSQAFAEVLKEFMKIYKWIIKPVSIDGVILKDFPDSIRDSSIANEMQVNYFPSLFVVDRITKEAKPIAYGMATISNIEENILIQFKD